MEKNKGFTLIELLAVIVILGVITIVAVPKILDVINKSRESAANSSIKLVKDAIKTQVASSNLLGADFIKESDECYIFDFDDQSTKNVRALNVKNKDKISGSIKYCNNIFYDDNLKFNGFAIKEDNSKNNYITTNLQLNLDANKSASNSSWNDLSGNNLNGKVNGAIYKKDNYYFKGFNSYISLGEVNFDTITYEITFIPKILDSNERTVIANHQFGGYGIIIEGGYIKAEVRIGGSYRIINSLEKYEVNKIYTTQVTYDGNILKLYINGVLQGSIEIEGKITLPDNNTELMIGTDPNGSTPSSNVSTNFVGNVYSLRIYDGALTEKEIMQNYKIDQKKYKVPSTKNYTNYYESNLQLNLEGENATDSVWKDNSTNKIDGTIKGPIRQGKGYYFDGSDDYISLTQMNYDYMTIEATFKPLEYNGSEKEVITNFESGGYGIVVENKYIYGYFYINGSYKYVRSINEYELNKVYSVQATYDGNIIELYVNGILQGLKEEKGVIEPARANTITMLGANPSGTSSAECYFKGIIHSARIYNVALDEDAIMQNYNIDYKKYLK